MPQTCARSPPSTCNSGAYPPRSPVVKSHPIQVVKASPIKIHRTPAGLPTAVRACRACDAHLPLGPRLVVQVGMTARILVVGQAPDGKVRGSGVSWGDKSGERLRDWMGIDSETFYDKTRIAILPMGYCYPGRAVSGDLPPRRECAELWLDHLLAKLRQIELTFLVGQHAQPDFLSRQRSCIGDGDDAQPACTRAHDHPVAASFAAQRRLVHGQSLVRR